MRSLAVLLLLALPGAALAETWIWNDADGGENYTDDPSTVPDAARPSLRVLGESDDEDGGSFSMVDETTPEESEADQRERVLRLQQVRSLEQEAETLGAAIDKLSRELVHAQNEHRKWKVGGRIGAADKAAAAEAKAEQIAHELAGKQAQLEGVKGRLSLLR